MGGMKAEIRLLQISDPHLFGRDDGALRGVVTRASLQGVLQHARAHCRDADALLLTGDLVNDDAGGYAAVRELFGTLGKPVWCLPGNHDDPDAMRRELAAAPFRIGGHHDLGAWRIVMLDSCVPRQAYGRLGESELERLEAALAGSGERHVLIGLHHHPVRLGSAYSPWRPVDESALIEASGRFFASAVAPLDVARRLFENFFDGLRRRLALPENGEPLWDWLDAQAGVSSRERRQLQNLFARVYAGERVDLTRLHNLLSALQGKIA